MVELIAGGFLIGVTAGAPIGPIGTASLVQIMAGNRQSALAGMAGCIAAEMTLFSIAILATAELKAYLTALPPPIYFGLGLLLLAIGFYFMFASQMPNLGRVASFLVAFKVTLLSPHNLLALMALIAAMGLAPRLDSPRHDLALIGGELLGLVACWAGAMWLGWRMRANRRVEVMLPWLRRGVGILLVFTALAIVARQI